MGKYYTREPARHPVATQLRSISSYTRQGGGRLRSPAFFRNEIGRPRPRFSAPSPDRPHKGRQIIVLFYVVRSSTSLTRATLSRRNRNNAHSLRPTCFGVGLVALEDVAKERSKSCVCDASARSGSVMAFLFPGEALQTSPPAVFHRAHTKSNSTACGEHRDD